MEERFKYVLYYKKNVITNGDLKIQIEEWNNEQLLRLLHSAIELAYPKLHKDC